MEKRSNEEAFSLETELLQKEEEALEEKEEAEEEELSFKEDFEKEEIPLEEDSSRQSEHDEEEKTYEELASENGALKMKISQLEEREKKLREKEEAMKKLSEKAGYRTEIFEGAMKEAEEREELSHLPYDKKYELGYLLYLGKKQLKAKREAPPRFASTGGAGDVASSPMKKPTTFAEAKANAKKYFR